MVYMYHSFLIHSSADGETDHQPRLDALDKCSGLGHWEDPEGAGREGGGRGYWGGDYV